MPNTIPVVENIMSANDQIAAQTRIQLDRAGVLALNIMASPGGKTSVIPGIEALHDEMRMGCHGWRHRADRPGGSRHGILSLINTGATAPDANMVHGALPSFLDDLDLDHRTWAT